MTATSMTLALESGNVSEVEVLAKGSRTPRTLANHLATTIHVEDEGAIGDNSADDQAAIQLALARAPVAASGTGPEPDSAIIVIGDPNKTYNIDSGLFISGRSFVTLRDIHLSSTTAGLSILTINQSGSARSRDIWIDNVTLEGNGGASNTQSGIFINGTTRVWVEDSSILEVQTGLNVASATANDSGTFRRNTFISTDITSSVGMRIANTDNFLETNKILGYDAGIHIVSAPSQLLAHNHIFRLPSAAYSRGIRISRQSNNFHNGIRLIGNQIDNANVAHLTIETSTGGSGVQVIGNWFVLTLDTPAVPFIRFEEDGAAHGAVFNVFITGNDFSYTGASTYTGDGIAAIDGLTYDDLRDSVIDYNGFQGLPIVRNVTSRFLDTISGGVIQRSQKLLLLAAESGTTDDLDRILLENGEVPGAGTEVFLRRRSSHTITVKHSGTTGSGRIQFDDSVDRTMNSDLRVLHLIIDDSGTWRNIFT